MGERPTGEGPKPEGTVFVTGGSRGIGLEICRAIVADGHAVVAVARRRTRDLDEVAMGSDGRLSFLPADLSTTDGQDAVAARVRACRDLRGLVNNAGIAVARLHIAMAPADAERMWAVNVAAPMRLSQAAVKAMHRAGGGRIVNISSVCAHRAYRGLGAYTATKCALEGFSRVLAAEVGYRKITVNCVAPGLIDTDMTAGLPDPVKEAVLRRGALDRPTTPGDVAAMVSFLLSSAADAVTGQVIRVDSGAIV
jgi:3-oxoacyl-[acyl-carrier protein] reductase